MMTDMALDDTRTKGAADPAWTEGALDPFALELRRGVVALACLSQLEEPRYGWALQQRLAERGMEIEQGTLYPLLRRLHEQGLLESEWKVEGSRPRKYYRLTPDGRAALSALGEQWNRIVAVLDGLLDGTAGEVET